MTVYAGLQFILASVKVVQFRIDFSETLENLMDCIPRMDIKFTPLRTARVIAFARIVLVSLRLLALTRVLRSWACHQTPLFCSHSHKAVDERPL